VHNGVGCDIELKSIGFGVNFGLMARGCSTAWSGLPRMRADGYNREFWRVRVPYLCWTAIDSVEL
jgi:hypothetical protein